MGCRASGAVGGAVAGVAGIPARAGEPSSSCRTSQARSVMTGRSGESAADRVASASATLRPGRRVRAVTTRSATGTGERMSKVSRAGSARAGSPPRRRTQRVSNAEGGPACCSPAAQGPVVCTVERTRALSSRARDRSPPSARRRPRSWDQCPAWAPAPGHPGRPGMGLTTGQRPPSSSDAHAAVGSSRTTFTGTPQIRQGGSMGPCNDRIRTNAARCVRIGGHRPQQGEGGSHETGNTICRGNSAGCLAYRGCCAECIRAHPHSWTWPGGAGRRGWRGADGGCGQQLGDSRDLG